MMRENSQTHENMLRCKVRLVEKKNDNDDKMMKITIFNFIRSRDALLLEVMLLSISLMLTQYVNRLHSITIID